MIRVALLLGAALFAACTPAVEETPEEVRVTRGLGGFIGPVARFYAPFYDGTDPRRIVVDGPVVSADAMFAMGAPGACYTDRAVWQPHGAMSLTPGLGDAELTEAMAGFLPAPLREWFLAHHSSRLTLWGVATVDAERLRELWPDGYCGEGA